MLYIVQHLPFLECNQIRASLVVKWKGYVILEINEKDLSITICPSLDIWKDFIDTFAFWAITWGGDSKILLKQLHCIYQNWCARIFQISVTLRKFSRNEMCISSHITMYIKLLHLMDHAQNYIFTNDASWSSFDDTHIGIMHMNHSYNFFNFWVARLVVAFMPVTSCRRSNAHLKVFPTVFSNTFIRENVILSIIHQV